MTRFAKTTLASVVVGAAALASIAASSSAGSDAIKARQDAMEDIGDAIKTLGAIAKGEAGFDASVVKKNAGTIADRLGKVAKLFPEGSDKGDLETWAKPEIWSDLADFQKKREAARESAVALESVTKEEAFRPALGQLGQNCKACHDKYRRPKS